MRAGSKGWSGLASSRLPVSPNSRQRVPNASRAARCSVRVDSSPCRASGVRVPAVTFWAARPMTLMAWSRSAPNARTSSPTCCWVRAESAVSAVGPRSFCRATSSWRRRLPRSPRSSTASCTSRAWAARAGSSPAQPRSAVQGVGLGGQPADGGQGGVQVQHAGGVGIVGGQPPQHQAAHQRAVLGRHGPARVAADRQVHEAGDGAQGVDGLHVQVGGAGLGGQGVQGVAVQHHAPGAVGRQHEGRVQPHGHQRRRRGGRGVDGVGAGHRRLGDGRRRVAGAPVQRPQDQRARQGRQQSLDVDLARGHRHSLPLMSSHCSTRSKTPGTSAGTSSTDSSDTSMMGPGSPGPRTACPTFTWLASR